MKRVGTTLQNGLELALENYVVYQEVKPLLRAVVQAAGSPTAAP
jgi:hypothetical protein